MDGSLARVRVKPRLRGVSHLVACVIAAVAGTALVAAAGTRGRPVAAVYAATLVALFGVSALYHVPTWRPGPRRWLRRLDHAAIFLFIAGTYTPFCRLLPDDKAGLALAIVWGGAAAGILQALFWVEAPKPLTAVIYLVLGWVMLPFLPAFHALLGTSPLALLAGGGLVYSVGAMIYARRRPDPVPHVFGYHEVFHALVIAASVMHFAAETRVLRVLG